MRIGFFLYSRTVASLGTTMFATHQICINISHISFAFGEGLGIAASSLVGQNLGAKRPDLAKSFAWLTTACGVAVMSLSGIAMYFLCPYVFAFLTPVEEVRALGVQVLRIELFAEPMFASSIVATGALRGAGDTLIPGILNLISMWGVRIMLALALVGTYGLPGIWTAMCIELNVRGILFLIRLARGSWLKKAMAKETAA
jgi:Na+-driven multidrug efflux pump